MGGFRFDEAQRKHATPFYVCSEVVALLIRRLCQVVKLLMLGFTVSVSERGLLFDGTARNACGRKLQRSVQEKCDEGDRLG